MNETQLKEIRSHFKNSETSRISVKEMVAVYLKKDTEEVFHSKECYFEMLDEDDKDFLMKNFKKVLSGGLNKNVFELRFNEEVEEDNTQDILDTLLLTENVRDFAIESNAIIAKIMDNFTYDTDVVVHIIRFELDTEDQIVPFVLGTVNKVENPKGVFVFNDDAQRDFTTEYGSNKIINVTSPIDGFMYPAFEDGQANVNKIINYHKKANETNAVFIGNVLNCNVVLTAKQEKTMFNMILKQALGQKVKPRVLANIYSIIFRAYETEEDMDQRLLSRGELERILESQNIEIQGDLQHTYEDVIGVQTYSFKVDSIVPDFSKKSVTIETDEADVIINPRHLDRIRQVKDENGEMYLMVKLNRDSSTEGLSLDSDEIAAIEFSEE